MTSIPQRWVGVAYAVLAVLLFSSFTLTSRAGLTTGLRPPDIAALRFGIGGLLLSPVLAPDGYGFSVVTLHNCLVKKVLGGVT